MGGGAVLRGGGWTPINWLKNIDPITLRRANNRKSFNRGKTLNAQGNHWEFLLAFFFTTKQGHCSRLSKEENPAGKIKKEWLITVLGIHGIVARIRISGSGYCYFRQWPSKWQLKIIFMPSFFVYYFLKLHLHNFSKIKSHKEVKKQEEWRFFLKFLLYQGRIRIRIPNTD